eukprot:scaffold1793_cov173-Amphora_coffeaeformis.AAC.7
MDWIVRYLMNFLAWDRWSMDGRWYEQTRPLLDDDGIRQGVVPLSLPVICLSLLPRYKIEIERDQALESIITNCLPLRAQSTEFDLRNNALERSLLGMSAYHGRPWLGRNNTSVGNCVHQAFL